MSLDQKVKAAAHTSAESKASQIQGHTTSIKQVGRERECADRRSTIPIPREATSVATMMGLFPVLNSFKTQSRSFCCLSPWIAILKSAVDRLGVRARSTYTALAIHLVVEI